MISRHQPADRHEIADALRTMKEAGLIPQEKVRLCVVADGADWIWNRVQELFPDARQVMDFSHCSQYLHRVAAAQNGKGSEKALEWVHAALVRLSLSEQSQVHHRSQENEATVGGSAKAH